MRTSACPAKAAWQVRAGILAGEPRPQLCKSWVYSSLDYEADQKLGPSELTRFTKLVKEASEYWSRMNNPSESNWAELTFIWY